MALSIGFYEKAGFHVERATATFASLRWGDSYLFLAQAATVSPGVPPANIRVIVSGSGAMDRAGAGQRLDDRFGAGRQGLRPARLHRARSRRTRAAVRGDRDRMNADDQAVSDAFIAALEAGDLEGVRRASKGESHTHGRFGGDREWLAQRTGHDIAPAARPFASMAEMDAWTAAHVADLFTGPEGRASAGRVLLPARAATV